MDQSSCRCAATSSRSEVEARNLLHVVSRGSSSVIDVNSQRSKSCVEARNLMGRCASRLFILSMCCHEVADVMSRFVTCWHVVN